MEQVTAMKELFGTTVGVWGFLKQSLVRPLNTLFIAIWQTALSLAGVGMCKANPFASNLKQKYSLI